MTKHPLHHCVHILSFDFSIQKIPTTPPYSHVGNFLHLPILTWLSDVYLAKLTTKHTVLKELKKHSKETKANHPGQIVAVRTECKRTKDRTSTQS